MPGEAISSWLLAPRWAIQIRAGGASVFDLVSEQTLSLDGGCFASLAERPPDALRQLERLARFSPDTGRFLEDLQRHEPRPLDRAALLRGPGYHLLFVELTGRCNECCAHCYAESGPHRGESLSAEVLEGVLEDARALGFTAVQFTGGDPLLSPLLLPGIRRARELGMAGVEVFTNGLILEGKLYESLREQKVAFAFSFYSHDPAIHDFITRTPGSQARTARAIRQAVADGLVCRAGVVGMEANRATLRETVSFLKDLGLPQERIHVSFQREVGRGHETAESPLEHGPGSGDRAHTGGSSRGFSGRAAVAYDGHVYPCIFGRQFPLGNVYRTRLRAILDDPQPIPPQALDNLERQEDWRIKFACRECRVRACLLEPLIASCAVAD